MKIGDRVVPRVPGSSEAAEDASPPSTGAHSSKAPTSSTSSSSAALNASSTTGADEERRLREKMIGAERSRRESDRLRPDAEMLQPLVELDPHRLESVLEDMALLVREKTGLKLDTSQVNVAIVSRDEALERALADARATFGTNEPDGLVGKLKEELGRAALKGAIQGVHLPNERTVLIVRESTGRKGIDSVRSTMFHELVHVAQHQNYPEFFDAMKDVYREMQAKKREHGPESDAYLDARDTFNARMAFIEGHPTYLQSVLTEREFPRAGRGTSLSEVASSLVFMLSRSGREKVGQYLRGKVTFEKLLQTSAGKPLVTAAYENPSIVDLLLKTRGHVDLVVRDDAPKEQVDALVTACARFGWDKAGLKTSVKRQATGGS